MIGSTRIELEDFVLKTYRREMVLNDGLSKVGEERV